MHGSKSAATYAGYAAREESGGHACATLFACAPHCLQPAQLDCALNDINVQPINKMGCPRADIYEASNNAAKLQVLLNAHPDVRQQAKPDSKLYDKLCIAAGTSTGAQQNTRRQQLQDANLCPAGNTALVSAWLRAVFQYQLPRGLHRWVTWS